jgi:hypothetical protein
MAYATAMEGANNTDVSGQTEGRSVSYIFHLVIIPALSFIGVGMLIITLVAFLALKDAAARGDGEDNQ